ncbi:acyltransferase family protein [Bacteroides zhangwenhongii]|uniref:acyltransferase family protein n=1 Tax=Bacteroides zhangwenhongii TaxID=2650157 RepID=UPI003AAFEFFA
MYYNKGEIRQQKVRNSNFEALRILCMLFIVAGHLIKNQEFDSLTYDRFYTCGVVMLFVCAVNCFVLISGWYGINFSWKKIIKLNDITTFYALTLGGMAVILGAYLPDTQRVLKIFIPSLTREFWFITVYLTLCILSPYLNILVQKLPKEDFKRLLIICSCLFILQPTCGAVMNFESITLDSGYGIINFSYLYLIGRYFRLYNNPHKKARVYFLYYLLIALAGGVFQIIYSYILGFEFTTLKSYNTIFCFLASIFLFCGFSRLNFDSYTVNYIAKFCFSVYLIHAHPWCFSWFYNKILGMNNISDGNFFIALTVVPILTYVVCIIVESVRTQLYRLHPIKWLR